MTSRFLRQHGRPQGARVDAAEMSEEQLRAAIDASKMPQHIAVIMDGNGRWAAQHHRPRMAGHQAGIEAVRATVESCARLGVPALTLYAFSAENWKRPQTEVTFLMKLLRRFLRAEVAELKQNNIRLEAIGRLHELAPEVQRELNEARAATQANTGMRLTLALNYGARAELVDAVRAMLAEAGGKVDAAAIDEERLRSHLYTAQLPDPDLLIRTSGEMRISNFLLWQIAYAEIWVTPVLWPDFRARHMYQAIVEFQNRERRFGGLGGVAQTEREAATPRAMKLPAKAPA